MEIFCMMNKLMQILVFEILFTFTIILLTEVCLILREDGRIKKIM